MQLGGGAIEDIELAVTIARDHPHADAVEDGIEKLLLAFELVCRLAALRDVMQERAEEHLCADQVRTDGHLDGNQTA